MMADTSVQSVAIVANANIQVADGVNQDAFHSGKHARTIDKRVIIPLCRRNQKSESSVLPAWVGETLKP